MNSAGCLYNRDRQRPAPASHEENGRRTRRPPERCRRLLLRSTKGRTDLLHQLCGRFGDETGRRNTLKGRFATCQAASSAGSCCRRRRHRIFVANITATMRPVIDGVTNHALATIPAGKRTPTRSRSIQTAVTRTWPITARTPSQGIIVASSF